MKKYMISITLILICSVTLIACTDDEDTADNQTNNDQENMEENNEDAQNENGNQTNDNQDNINENDRNSEEADENTSNNPSDSTNDSETDGDTEVKEDTEAEEDAYDSYENGRFGFSVEYPSTFEADYMPENNDGIEVNDDTATIIASGSHASITEEGTAFVNEVESIEPYYEGELAEAEEEGESISYQRQEDDWYVVSYNDGTNHIYKKSILGDDYIANLVIEYPADLQEEYEPMVERVSDTFSIP
ncbi:hypothetical protein [Oceanobacillus locisalsi]|uniref:PsbP C-terminal domain-containing protein n=1 Tax=Oceanobacillus locisalsi TaxID=546107 RepID=A0ABW3NBF5_9BACI